MINNYIGKFFLLPSFSLLLCVNKREKDGVKERKSTHRLEVVKDFSARHVEGETRNISKMTHKSNVMAMFRCAQHDGKFAPQNLTTSKIFTAPLRVQLRAFGSYEA